MSFYHDCLGGELTLTKLGETTMKDQFPSEKYNKIINAHLKSGDIEISATDWLASPSFDPVQGNTYAIFVTGSIYDELKAVFDKLKDDKNYMKCRLVYMGNFMINMACSGSLDASLWFSELLIKPELK